MSTQDDDSPLAQERSAPQVQDGETKAVTLKPAEPDRREWITDLRRHPHYAWRLA
jgi:hypothetical protein